VSLAKAVTLIRPWPAAILLRGKRTENRSWQTHYRGPLILHAGVKYDPEAIEVTRMIAGATAATELQCIAHPVGYVGIVDLVDVHPGPDPYSQPDPDRPCRCDAWGYDGVWHWVVENPRPFPTVIPGPGRRMLFDPPVEVVDRARLWGLL
jgi:hypothetical protein